MERSIVHLDMDAFFASVEQRDFSALRGKPVLVGYDGPRGVVAAASYESRVFGCRSAQPMAVAKRLCPQAIVVPVRHGHYREVSQQMFGILEAFSPAIEPLSIDEAFLDLTGTEQLLGPAEVAAGQMKARIKAELKLTASVGVAANKFLAKLASDMQKPDGLTVIRTDEVEKVLGPMPVSRIWGVGPAMEARLKLLGIATIGELRGFPLEVLKGQLGEEAEHYFQLAHGIDARPVSGDGEAKSIGHEQTFDVNVGDPAVVRRVLMEQVDQVGRRLRRHKLLARRVVLKIRFGEFQTITRSGTLPALTDSTAELETAAAGLFEVWAKGSFQPVRLIGVSASQLSAGETQPGLFSDPAQEKQKKIDAVSDAISRKFGGGAIRRGGTLE